MEGEHWRIEVRQVAFAAELPEEIVNRLVGHGQLEQFQAGQVVFRQGVLAEAFYLIFSGRVALQMQVPGRGMVTILTLGRGDMLGWSSLLGKRTMTATATAVEPVRLLRLSADALRQQCETDHEFGFFMMRRMAQALAERLLATRLQLLDLFANSPSVPPVPAATKD